MPDESALSDEEIAALSDEDADRDFDRMRLGTECQYDGDPVEEARELAQFDEEWADVDESVYLTDIEKARAPLIAEAVYADALQNIPNDAPPPPVEGPDPDEAIKMLVLAVWHETRQWPKPPKVEAIGAAITYTVAQTRREQGVQHPRDIAKIVGCRYATFLRVTKAVAVEIQRLALRDQLRESGNL